MVCLYLVLLFLGSLHGIPQGDGGGTINSSFDEESSEYYATMCECVPWYLCGNNDAVITDGAGLLDKRIRHVKKEEECPDPMDICCGISVNTDEGFPYDGKENTKLPRNMPCDCMSYTECPEHLIVNDGQGETCLNVARSASSHSQCPRVIDVCCANDTEVDTYLSSALTPAMNNASNSETCECVEPYMCDKHGYIKTIYEDSFNEVGTNPRGKRKLNMDMNSCSNSGMVCCHPRVECECVDQIQCDEEGFIITDGSFLIEIRTLGSQSQIPGTCDDPCQVCCKHREEEEPDNFTTTSLPTDITTTTTSLPTEECYCVEESQCGDYHYGKDLIIPRTLDCHNPAHICCINPLDETTNAIISPATSPSPIPDCGKRNRKGTLNIRIMGFKDDQSQFGEFPWVATVLREKLIMNKPHLLFIGGGILIHPQVVLTAAHNIQSKKELITSDELVIRLGEWDTQTVKEPLEHQDIKVERVVIHPNFNTDNLKHDVALLFLKEEANLNNHIQKICLAKDISEVDPNDCIINGWGKDGFDNEGEYQLIMKSVTLPLVMPDTCQAQLRRNTELGRFFRLHKSFICAGGEAGQDSCKGDGGGPLACARRGGDKDSYLLVGITAWGIGCGGEGVPGVYANVPHHYDWINEKIEAVYPTTATPPARSGTEESDAELSNKKFLVTLKTGYGKDADSNSSLVVILKDQNGTKIRNILRDLPKQDETDKHRVSIPKSFGRIAFLNIALNNEDEVASDWFCEHIFVEDPRINDILYFPIDRRIGGNQLYKFKNYATSLPQYDQNKKGRKLTLQNKKNEYNFAYEMTAAKVKALPKDEVFHKDYFGSLVALSKSYNLEQIPLFEAWQRSNNISAFYGGEFYEPESMQLWKEDAWFGSQRVQGIVPNLIELCNQIPDKLGVTEETVSGLLEGSTLQQALEQNKIFITDLEVLDGIDYSNNVDHASPIAVFYLNKRNQLMPIAIQLRQRKGPNNPVYTPKDPSNTWLVAKIYYNNAEAQYHQPVAHVGYTHTLMDGIATSMNRQLSPSHPVFKLMKPHFLNLLAINKLAEQTFLAPGGSLDQFSIGLDGAKNLLLKVIPAFTFERAIGSVESDARARGVWDKEVLPYYPFRDDALSMYNIIKKYVTSVINHYYDTPGAIADDLELQSWRSELAKPRAEGGVGITDLPGSNTAGFNDIDEIIDLVTMLINHNSVGHAAVNFTQYDTYGYMPNYPVNIREGPPLQKRSYTEDGIMSLLPDLKSTLPLRATWLATSWQGTNDCGDFERVYLYDPVSRKAQMELKKDLAAFSKEVGNRNNNRVFPYRYVDPNYVPNSISV